MLRRRSRELATAVAISLVLAIAALIGHDGAGAAPAPAAPTVPQPKQKIVVFVPHADDDALSMGVFVQAQQRAGKDVTVVYYTDGAGTGVCALVDGKCTQHDAYEGKTKAEFVAYRDSEYRNAVSALGVPDDHIQIYTPKATGVRIHDGLVTVAEMDTMLREYNANPLYSQATFFTMSWLDNNLDHAAAGIALRQLVANRVVAPDRALFTMARWYWAYAYPERADSLTDSANRMRVAQGYPTAVQMMSCEGDDDCTDRLQKSLRAYGPCPDENDVPDKCTGIGYMSVKGYLDIAYGDPRIIIHSVDSGRYPTRMTVTSTVRRVGSTTKTDVSGFVIVPSYGRYGTDYTKPENAPWLVQTVDSKRLTSPFSGRSRTIVTALDIRKRPVATTKLSLTSAGVFRGAVSIPAAATSLSFYSEATQGAMPATTVVPVQTQRVTFVPKQKAVKIHKTTVTGHYGQTVQLRTRPTVAGRTTPRLTTAIRSGGVDIAVARTGVSGYSTLVGTLGTSRYWYVTSSAPRDVVPAIAARVRTKVAPAVLKVRPKTTAVRVHAGRVTVAGAVAGRHYRIAKSYLAPVTVRLYRVGKSGKALYAGSVRTARGGAFTTTIPARKGEKITFRVVGLAHTFATVKNAGSVSAT